MSSRTILTLWPIFSVDQRTASVHRSSALRTESTHQTGSVRLSRSVETANAQHSHFNTTCQFFQHMHFCPQMTYIVSGGALNSTHWHTHEVCRSFRTHCITPLVDSVHIIHACSTYNVHRIYEWCNTMCPKTSAHFSYNENELIFIFPSRQHWSK